MTKSLNSCQFIGNLGADPELRYLPNGTPVANFSVAVSRTWKNDEGEQQEATEWVRIVAWNKLAEICNQYLMKGSKVYVEGRMQTDKYQDKDSGEDRYSTKIVISDMIMLDNKRQSGSDEESEEEAAPAPRRQAAQKPAQRQQAAQRRNVPQPIDDDDDSMIPF